MAKYGLESISHDGSNRNDTWCSTGCDQECKQYRHGMHMLWSSKADMRISLRCMLMNEDCFAACQKWLYPRLRLHA